MKTSPELIKAEMYQLNFLADSIEQYCHQRLS